MSAVTAEVAVARVDSRPGALWQFGRNRVAVFGATLIAVIAIIAILAPVLPLADPDHTDLARRMAPPFSGHNLLGTDQLGRDMLSRLVWGTRVSLFVGVVGGPPGGPQRPPPPPPPPPPPGRPRSAPPSASSPPITAASSIPP